MTPMKKSVLFVCCFFIFSTCSDFQGVAIPEMDQAAGVYSADIEVAISSDTSGATIYYTTDGTDPTSTSTAYTSPISVAGDGTVLEVRAVAQKAALYDSDIAAETYFIDYSAPTPTPGVTPTATAAPLTWNDQGIVYEASGGEDAYYPSIIYDADGFGSGTPQYSMWYTDGSGGTFLVTSADGSTWSTPTTMVGLTNPHHVQVLYDAACFGALPCNAGTTKYRVWFWNFPTLYDISAIASAESADGITWVSQAAITQNASAKLIEATGWNRGSYGPIFLFYQSVATNTGTNPWNYSYVMYFNGTDGAHEQTGLAYSADGSLWSAYSPYPVLAGSDAGGDDAWDCWSISYGTVLRDAEGFRYFYSARGEDDGSGGCANSSNFVGIGFATSEDGRTFARSGTNPIFHVDDGMTYRDGRIYTPVVVDDGSGALKMYYSARADAGGAKKIGLAILE